MPRWMLRWILNIGAILFTAWAVKGFDVTVLGAVFGSMVLGFVNAVIRPIIILLTLPINILTLGLFTLVINGFMLWLTSAIVKGFDLNSFGAAVLAALLLSVLSFIISFFVPDNKRTFF